MSRQSRRHGRPRDHVGAALALRDALRQLEEAKPAAAKAARVRIDADARRQAEAERERTA